MVFIWFYGFFMDLLKVSVWDPINLPSDCCWSCHNTQNVWCWGKTFISNRWPARSFPRSKWVKKFNLQITFMHIHYSHYTNPPKCIIDTGNIQKTQCFLYLFLLSMICQNKTGEILYCEFVSLWAILLQDIGTKWWLLLVPGRVFDFAKPSSRSAWTLSNSSWLTPKNVMETITLIKHWLIAQNLVM